MSNPANQSISASGASVIPFRPQRRMELRDAHCATICSLCGVRYLGCWDLAGAGAVLALFLEPTTGTIAAVDYSDLDCAHVNAKVREVRKRFSIMEENGKWSKKNCEN